MRRVVLKNVVSRWRRSGKLMQRASELRCRDADHFCISRQHGGRDDGGWRVAGKATHVACRKKGRFSVSDCWKARRRGVGEVGFRGSEVNGVRGRGGGRGRVWLCGWLVGCLFFAESDGIWQRSLFLSALTFPTLTSHHPARPQQLQKTNTNKRRRKTVIHPDILPSHESIK